MYVYWGKIYGFHKEEKHFAIRLYAFSPSRFVERMLNFTDRLRSLRVDYYEYVAMKVIVLLTSGKRAVPISMVETIKE